MKSTLIMREPLSSVRPKPPFWFRPDTETETENLAETFGRNFRPIPKQTETIKSYVGERCIKGPAKIFHVMSSTKAFIWYTTNKYYVNQL